MLPSGLPCERRVLLIGEGIRGDVRHIARKEFLQVEFPVGEALGGNPEDEVETDVGETFVPGGTKGIVDLAGPVRPAEDSEQTVVETLRADTQAVDSVPPKDAQFLPGERAGIGLDGELRRIRKRDR